VVDLDAPWIVREADIRSRSKNTCFEGARLQGKVLQTMVAGRTVFRA
jgi:dihydroorotase